MKKDVLKFVRQCLSCQCAKASKCKFGLLRPFQEGEPWGTVHVDVVGPLRFQNEERFLITAIDSFGAWVEVQEVYHSPTSADFVSFLVSEIITRHGVPKRIVSDNGSILVSEVSKMFYKDTGIRITTTSTYHPQANGKIERFHRFLKETLRASQTLTGEEFSNKLPWIIFAYRTTYHEGIREIPFFVYHGFDARMPSSLTPPHQDIPRPSAAVQRSTSRYQALKVREHIAEIKDYIYGQRTRSMQKMKKIYDGPRSDYRFQMGDYVLVWDHRKRQKMRISKSLLLRWRGPFRVIEVLSPTNYKLQYVLDNKVIFNSHVIHMRPFDGDKFTTRKRDERLSVAESDILQSSLDAIAEKKQIPNKNNGEEGHNEEVVQDGLNPPLRRSARLKEKKKSVKIQ